MTTPATDDLDLFADELLVDPYPAYARLRELGDVVHLPTNDVYALTGYDAIRSALGDWETYSSAGAIGFNPMVNEALTGTSLSSDPPVHTQLRATLSENLSPRALRGLKDTIETKADALVADLVERGSFEAIDELARELPLEVVADLIGFTGHVRANMLRWGQAAMQVIGPLNQRTAESFPIAGELYGWCSTVTAVELAPGSVGRGIFDAEVRGEIPPGSAGHIIHQYLGAGIDTTIAALGNVIALFAAHPDQLAAVRSDPALVPAAFNEALRFWAPVHAWGRRTTREVTIDGAVVPEGAQVAILFGAGNRDPRHYDRPDEFLVERNPVDHLSFGYGPHGCAGQGLARLEVHAVIASLAKRVSRLSVGDAVRVPSNITRSIEELPVLEVVPA
ncbi:cytochrome [Nocardioides sp. Root1257]|uniref:cytochrome P450 n=1 Tax=unclassified Nocardioides TaxID=2615069 RepID=UPI0006FC4F00|nr:MULTISPECIES: cytochrome P450 [unclassified Nocardioides]KQW47335.1 cytochrome [Nocardioides sp. Root1257]KRC45491.1 cytochrome [Nocardioides sp. Root224]